MPGRDRITNTTSIAATEQPWVVITGGTSSVDASRSIGDSIAPLHWADRFSPADLAGQFVLCRSDDAVPSGWALHQHRGWSLGTHPWLPVTRLVANDGIDVGWLLGFPIDEKANFVETSTRLPFSSHAAPGEFEAWLYKLCGRYLAIWLTRSYERVYLDSAGLLPAVFSPGHDMVASTTSLVPYTRGCDDDYGLLRACSIPDGKATLAFGLTSRFGVERLHPNHYLDLNHWRPRRHWPGEPLDNRMDRDEAIHIVSRSIERQVAAAVRRGQTLMALTAGYDSRSILACSREYLDRMQHFTLAIPDRGGKLDVDVATKLAARHGLRHSVVPHVPSTRQDLDGWLWRTGFSLSDPRGWQTSRTYEAFKGELIEISGVAGEAARVAYWRDCGSGRERLTPRLLADCVSLPPHAGILASVRSWMNSYPATTPVQMIDGFYIEHAMGAWAGNLAYGDAHSVRCRLYPFVSRGAIDAMLRLPEAYKLERRFPVDLIRHNWPELLRTPFNQRPGLRRHVDRFRRRAWLLRHGLAGALLHR